MKKLSAITALATATLIGITAGSAWSDAATPGGSAAPALQTPAPATAYTPGWYPPPPNQGGNAQPWLQPPQWPVPPPGYGRWPPHYPPRGQYHAVPAAPAVPAVPATAENPLSAELKQTQEQLTAKNMELDKAQAALEQYRLKLKHGLEAERALNEKVADITREQQALQARVAALTTELNTTTATLELSRQRNTNDQQQNRTLTAARDRLRDDLADRDAQLAALQAELQAATQALQQAQSETSTSGQQLNAARAQAETARNALIDLKAQLESQQAAQLNAGKTQAAELDSLRTALADRDAQLAALQAELQAATQALQQAQSETSTSGQQLNAARAQAETARNALTELKAQLESQQAGLLDTEKTLATVTAERDALLTDMAAVVTERNSLQTELAACSRELTSAQDALSDAQPEAATHSAQGRPDKVEPAAGNEPAANAAESAALQMTTTDADKDGVPDSIDLCPGTQRGTGVDSTGCVAGAAIKLEGVNFLYNSHELTAEAQRILDRVASRLSQHPDLRLEVAGHTDATGDPSYNQWLSLQRAEAVRAYLVTQGVNPRHIGATGYGGQRPIADNSTSEGLRQNRRVELRRLQ